MLPRNGRDFDDAGVGLRHIHGAETRHPQRPHDERTGAVRIIDAAELDQRRGQHHAVEPAMAAVRGADENRRAGGMAEREDRRRTIRQHDLAHEGLEIAVVFGKIAHIALASVAERTIRQTLPAPVERGDRKTARAQIAHRLEIFLDPFGATLENAHRAATPGRRQPARKAQADAVGRFEHAGDEVIRNRIGGN